MIINKFKYFLVSLDFLISRSFFFYQCRFKDVLKDFLFTIFKNKNFLINFDIINKSLDNKKYEFEFREDLAHQRGNMEYSKSYITNNIPNFIKDIIDINFDKISAYLGKNFVYEKPLFFRILKFPHHLSKFDVYSNIWHQDSHDGSKILKIFVLMDDVKKNDGPMCYLTRKETKKKWHFLRDRYTFDRANSDKDFETQKFCVGKKYDYFIINTSECLHKAKNPEKKRDMIQITLYPSWRKNNDRFFYEK